MLEEESPKPRKKYVAFKSSNALELWSVSLVNQILQGWARDEHT
jgi:hypothetical protein